MCIDEKIKIGIDTYGADNGEEIFVLAVKEISNKFDNIEYYLYGNENKLTELLNKYGVKSSNVFLVKTTEEIKLDEHPVMALRTKKDSTIYRLGEDLISGKISAIISAGSTGAILALGQLYVKTLDGIKRPAIATLIPTEKNMTLVIDSGANMDADSEWLLQYAILGSVYYTEMIGVDKPKVGLLNVGVEPTKGNKLSLDTYKLLSNDSRINFIGNIEARDITKGLCDVLVADGFNGNVILKMYEGVASSLFTVIKKAMTKNIITKFASLLLKKSLKNTLKKYDAHEYGGAPLIGCRNLILKCHGNAKKNEIYVCIGQAYNFINRNLIEKFNNSLRG